MGLWIGLMKGSGKKGWISILYILSEKFVG